MYTHWFIKIEIAMIFMIPNLNFVNLFIGIKPFLCALTSFIVLITSVRTGHFVLIGLYRLNGFCRHVTNPSNLIHSRILIYTLV